jgi:hypothetical protein
VTKKRNSAQAEKNSDGWDLGPASRNPYMCCGGPGGLIVLARS